MKHKCNVNNFLLSFGLVILLVLQTILPPGIANAESALGDSGTAIESRFGLLGSASQEADDIETNSSLLTLPPSYSVTMRSNSNASENGWIYQADMKEGTIEWKVEIVAADPAIPLAGLKFYNALDPIERGTYVKDSFKVNGVGTTPEGDAMSELAYTFPTDFGEKATITFKTWIPANKYYREYNSGDSGWQDVRNAAELRDSSNDTLLLSSNQWRVALKSDWIQVAGTLNKRQSTSDPRTITWTIDVNKNYQKQGLKDFTITDTLPNGLKFISANYRLWDSAARDWSVTKTPITPDENDVYSFGEVNGPIRLVIESEVIDSTKYFINRATAQWKLDVNHVQNNDKGSVWDTDTITIDAHSLTASSVITPEDFNTGAATWTVSLTPQEAIPDAAVYSLLVYGESIDLDQVDANAQVSEETLSLLKTRGGTTREYWQKYKAGSFKSSDGLQLEVIPLKQNGNRVADLLKVTGYDTDKKATFTFRSLQNHPDTFARQGPENGKTRYNRAHLIDGNEYVTYFDSYVNSHGRMLNNEMLYAVGPAGTNVLPNDVRHYVRNDSNETSTLAAYDQLTNTVTFRLAVNMNGLKTDEMALDGGNRVASDIRLVDTLPDGWEFVPFSAEKDFELWQGASGNGSNYEYGSKNDAQEVIEPDDPHHVVSFTANGNVGTFNFTKLESPYIILVKARPTENTRRQYFDSGDSKKVLYNKADLHIQWGGIDTVRTEQRKVIVVPAPVLEPGHLKLSTQIEGRGANPTKDFEYTIVFSDGKSYAYSGSKNGTVANRGTVTLKSGEAITFNDIPAGVTYTIVQNNYSSEGYTTSPADLTRTGRIVTEETAEAKFVNSKYLPTKLTIGMSVAGNGGDKNKEFEFTVTLDGVGASGTYNYTKSDNSTGTIQSGNKLSLKHGETFIISGIPKDTNYTVTETDYTADGYTTTWPDWKNTGTIAEEGDHKAEVINTRVVNSGGGGWTPSGNADLEDLAVYIGEDNILEGFLTEEMAYKIETGAGSVEIAGKTTNGSAKMFVNGKEFIDYLLFELKDGENMIELVVRAENGKEKTYTLIIEKVFKKIFTDINDHWAHNYIIEANKLGIFNGYPDGMFKPERKLERMHAATIFANLLGLDASETVPFSDVKSYDSETTAQLGAMYEAGLIRGYPNGTFGPRQPITRANFALIALRAFEKIIGEAYEPSELAPFVDIDKYDETTQKAITLLYDYGIVTGYKNNYMPANSTTRAEAAKMLVLMKQLVDERNKN